MFLNQLSKPAYKELFLELTILIMMAEGDESTTAKKILDDVEEKDLLLQIFWLAISEPEMEMISQYAEEAAVEDFRSINKLIYFSDFNIDERGINKTFENISYVLKQSIKFILDKYSDNKYIKTEILQILINNNYDVLDITPEITKKVILSLPQIRQEVLDNAVQILIKEKYNDIENIRMKEKKIILFELIGAGFSSGYFVEEERKVIENICQIMDIDLEYIEDFSEIIERMLTVNREANELINE